MSLDIKVYTSNLSDELIPKILKRLNDYEMIVEIHPEFSFNDQTGFLPFKFRLTNPHLEILKDKQLESGFELYIDSFDLKAEKEKLKSKPSFLDNLFGKKEPEIHFASEEIEARLKDCNTVVTFVWHAGETFQLRFASLTSAILAELTGGVCCYPADDIWYDNTNIVDNAYKELSEYERTLKQEEIDYREFHSW